MIGLAFVGTILITMYVCSKGPLVSDFDLSNDITARLQPPELTFFLILNMYRYYFVAWILLVFFLLIRDIFFIHICKDNFVYKHLMTVFLLVYIICLYIYIFSGIYLNREFLFYLMDLNSIFCLSYGCLWSFIEIFIYI